MHRKTPILVTGSHRSGTTWVAKMISASPSVRYVPEQFNLNRSQCLCGHQFNQWFQYISSENEENETQCYNHLKHALGLSYNFIPEFRLVKNYSDAFKLLTKASKFILKRLLNIRPLLKDPVAFFSAEWLANEFDMDVIVLIRHPAAFASSLKRLNWTFNFSHFVEQPLLMRDLLEPFANEIKEYSLKDYDIIDQAILVWNIFHYVILQYKKRHDRWIFLRHEDISQNPLEWYKYLYNRLELNFTSEISQTIKEYSYSNLNLPEFKNQEIHCLKRNSPSNIYRWKNNLNSNEITRIRKGVEKISTYFYSDTDW
ncbi:sulfotransferase [Coleofasciculus sp. F4-SAH-05]|uniref:sulfotransferase n=1 Tax=Coleofasciculus sp. F4-SAH-05 TaxID=3069525 RepID=UPI0032F2A76E